MAALEAVRDVTVPGPHLIELDRVSRSFATPAGPITAVDQVSLAFAPGEATELEQAYVRATYPYKDVLVYARAGIMHPLEGYGASDEPLGNMSPLFWMNTAKNAPLIWPQSWM